MPVFQINDESTPLLMSSTGLQIQQPPDDINEDSDNANGDTISISSESQRDEEVNHEEVVSDSNDNLKNYSLSLSLMFVLGGCGGVLAILPIVAKLIACNGSGRSEVNIVINLTANLVKIVYALLLTFLWILVLCRMKHWIATGYITLQSSSVQNVCSLEGGLLQNQGPSIAEAGNHSTSHIQLPLLRHQNQKAFRLAIVFFGTGGTIHLICQALFHTSIRISYIIFRFRNPIIYAMQIFASTFLDLFNIVSLIVQMFVFTKFQGAKLRSCKVSHSFIALFIVGNLWTWLTLTMTPIDVLTHNKVCLVHFNITNIESHFQIVIENITNVSEPFMVEFLTICMGILFDLWSTMDETQNKSTSREPTTRIHHRLHSVEETNDKGTLHYITGRRGKFTKKIRSGLLTVVLLLLPFFNFVLSVIFSGQFKHFSIKPPSHIGIYILKGITMTLYAPILVISTLSFRHSVPTRVRWRLSLLKVQELVLIFTNTVNYIHNFFHVFVILSIFVTAAAYSSHLGHAEQYMFLLIFACFSVAETCAHTSYLLRMKSLHDCGKKLTNLDKYGLIYSIGTNISCWMMQSLKLGWIASTADMSVYSPEFVQVFGDYTARLIVLMTYPIMSFYRFHAAVFAYEIFKDIKATA